MIVRFVLTFALVFLAGCAGMDERAASTPLEFELAGRIAVRFRDEAASGNVTWRHGADTDDMLITTPIGSSLARISRSGPAVTLTTADGVESRAADVEALTEKVLGFRLPLVGLADWVRGRPVDGIPATAERDAQGRLTFLSQHGWRIEYQAYQADGLPARLRLNFPSIELRLAIHSWSLPGRAFPQGTANGTLR